MMIKKTLMILSLTGATLVTSCDDAKKKAEEAQNAVDQASDLNLSMDNLSEKALGIVGDVPDMLLKVKDEASIDEASSKLDRVKTKIDGFVALAGKLPKLPKDKIAALGDQYGEKMDTAMDSKMTSVFKHINKLSAENPALKDKLNALMKKFGAMAGPLTNLFDEDGAIGKGAE